ncbi:MULTISPECIES: glycosyltransferase family 2 protein [Enterobacteriaceae]|jgi:NDP-sugar pyrophosphorylase family protein|uniref:NTP transferase domain-containing protein n=1 Tax=Intestinirhabdus alba TaxID=2899544 RepID=A0A6L6IKX9_9ENTR|nr:MULTISPECIES: glycosyltransferase family 2 protein [Enterobacteriaceae]EHM4904062.1 glycosyltransferase family 2 protein [Salmonella enterica]MTH47542.1 NTP transferase domain-containing protein [Intestinirhabdus alba]
MLNIVIPMTGLGSRFSQAGYVDPKPFISVAGVPMIELVISSLRPACPHRFIFICQQAHLDRYHFRSRLEELAPGCKIIGLSGLTEGAACSVLQAAPFIDNASPLMIANADQWFSADINDYLATMARQNLSGLLMTMHASSPKWSYACLNEQGLVTRVVEKEVVSEMATAGIYNFRHGRDFCRYARAMMDDNERSQGEFYVAPVYTRMYQETGARIGIYSTGRDGDGMHGLGTPEDLTAFLAHPVLSRALAPLRVKACI